MEGTTLREMTFDFTVLPFARVADARRLWMPTLSPVTEKPFGEEAICPPIQKGEAVSVVRRTSSTKYETLAADVSPVDETKIDPATVAGLIRPFSAKPVAAGGVVTGVVVAGGVLTGGVVVGGVVVGGAVVGVVVVGLPVDPRVGRRERCAALKGTTTKATTNSMSVGMVSVRTERKGLTNGRGQCEFPLSWGDIFIRRIFSFLVRKSSGAC